MIKKIVAILFFGLFVLKTNGQITVTSGHTPTWLLENVLLSGGVEISNVNYTGHNDAIGYFQTGINPTNLGISEGIIMSTGRVNGVPSIGAPASSAASTSNNTQGDPLLTAIAGMPTLDAAILEFEFVPLSDTIEFRYVFASEEYHNYVNQINDVFAFFVTGQNPMGGMYENQNIALLPGTNTPVSINTVNNGNAWAACSSGPCTNCQFFVDNCNGTSIVFNAFTTVLTARAVVVPCETYHLKIAIADASDRILDSAVFLEAKSLSTNALSIDIEHTIGGDNNYAVQGCSEAIIHFSIPEPIPDDFMLSYEIEGSAINGVDYEEIPGFIVIPAGETSATLVIDPIYQDGLQGTKEVRLVYSNLCLEADTIVIEIIDYIPPSATGFGNNDLCLSEAVDVEIGVNVIDGHEPYTYLWDNNAGDVASPHVSPSTTTTYNVLVTDVCGFETAASVTVTVFSDPDATIQGGTTICLNGIPPLVTFAASDGTPPYTFTYDINGGPPQTISPNFEESEASISIETTLAGTYVVNLTSVRDANSCSKSISESTTVIVTDVDIELSVLVSDVSCFGYNDGSVVLLASGGSGQLEYAINDENYSASSIFENLGPDDYSFFVRDELNCLISTLVNINEPEELLLVGFQTQDVHCNFIDSGGSVFLELAGGVEPYSFMWQDEDHLTLPFSTSFVDGIPEGSYSVTITDANGCKLEQVFFIDILYEDCIISIPQGFSPNGDGKNDTWVITNLNTQHPGNAVRVFNREGVLVYEASPYSDDWDGTPNQGNVLVGQDGKVPPGVYFFMIWFDGASKPISGGVFVSY